MLMIIFYTLVCLLAAYGALSLIISVFNSIRQKTYPECSRVKLALMVKNREDEIEGIIRNIFIGDYLKKVMSDGKLIVLDMGSTDETPEILAKLKKYYEYMDIVSITNKEDIFTYFETDE